MNWQRLSAFRPRLFHVLDLLLLAWSTSQVPSGSLLVREKSTASCPAIRRISQQLVHLEERGGWAQWDNVPPLFRFFFEFFSLLLPFRLLLWPRLYLFSLFWALLSWLEPFTCALRWPLRFWPFSFYSIFMDIWLLQMVLLSQDGLFPLFNSLHSSRHDCIRFLFHLYWNSSFNFDSFRLNSFF